MFSTITLDDVISLKSKQIGSNIKERVVRSLKDSYEKKVLGKINSYIISIVDVNEDSIKDGIINDINGDTNYKLEYTAVIFRPMKNHILDVTVDYCNDLGIWGHSSLLPEVSLIECICPRHMIPNEYSHDESNDSWIFDDDAVTTSNVIQEGSEIKLKVENTQIDATKMLIIGSLVK
jgi:DNA-directed RNA polymerase II subunit RPB7